MLDGSFIPCNEKNPPTLQTFLKPSEKFNIILSVTPNTIVYNELRICNNFSLTMVKVIFSIFYQSTYSWLIAHFNCIFLIQLHFNF